MTELLALPAWNVESTPLSEWVDRLRSQGLEVAVDRESVSVSWVEVRALGLRGYVMTEGEDVIAINFELTAPDPAPAREAVERAAAALSWEVDDEEADEEEEE